MAFPVAPPVDYMQGGYGLTYSQQPSLLNPDGSPRRVPLGLTGIGGGGTGLMSGSQTQSQNPLSFEDWMGTTGSAYTGDEGAAGVAYNGYRNNILNSQIGNLGSLPPGFLQSEYGQRYLSGLNDYQNGATTDQAATEMSLRNMPQAFSAGRSYSDFSAPVSNVPGVIDAAGKAAVAAASGVTYGAFGAGVNAVNSSGSSGADNGNDFTGGGMGSNGLFDNILGGVGNLSPAIIAAYLGNSQRQDVMGQVGKLNSLGDSLGGQTSPFLQAISNPYDLQTGMGRTALTQNLQQRGVGGSSFGNQQLGNYDYMRGMGRGDLLTKAGVGLSTAQGGLYNDALKGIVGGNAAYNSLLGAGLGASGSLFNRSGGSGIGSTGNGIFDWLKNYLGGGTGGSTDILPTPTDPNAGGQVDFGNDPGLPSQFDPNVDWSSLYG